MAGIGRTRIPTEQKIANGNPGKRKEDVDLSREATPDLQMPDMPIFVENDIEARAEWDRMGPILLKNRLISIADGQAFALYCMAWGRMVRAEEKLRHEELIVFTLKGGRAKNPLIAVINAEKEVIFKYLLQFGMTPAARTKVKVPKKSDEPDERAKRREEFLERQRQERERRNGTTG